MFSSTAFRNLEVREAFRWGFVRVTPIWVVFCVCAALRADAVGAAALSLPPLGEGGSRRLTDEGPHSMGYRQREVSALGLPSSGASRHLPPRGEGFGWVQLQKPLPPPGQRAEARKQGNCHPLAASEVQTHARTAGRTGSGNKGVLRTIGSKPTFTEPQRGVSERNRAKRGS